MRKPEVINGMTFEMAQAKVQGTKFKALNKFKKFATVEFDVEDMVTEIDMAIIKAWREWKPEESLFNTFVTNMINWMMYRALENHNDVFKMNRRTKMNLNNRGETFKTLSKKKLTADPEFNEKHGLDGEVEFTREHFNAYVYHVTSKVNGVNVRNQSEFNNSDGDALDILEMQADESNDVEMNEWEFNLEMADSDGAIKRVYDLIGEGYTIKDALKKAGTTRARLKTLIKKDPNLKKYAQKIAEKV